MQITKQGLTKLKNKLEYLTTIKRKEIAQRIRSAKELGDLSENAGYKEAKEEQALNESEINNLEQQIKDAQIFESKNIKGVVQLGSKVVLKTEQGTKIQFEIVNIQDSDPSKSKISVESPLGKELLGKKSGEIAQMIMPNKKLVKYKILQID